MPRFVEAARQSFLLQFRSKLYWGLLVLSILGTGAFAFITRQAQRVGGNELFEVATYLTGFMFFVPFVSLYLAVQAVSGDIGDRTSVYLFTRPVSRASLLIGKWLAAAVLAGLFATVVMTSLFLVITLAGSPWGKRLPPAVPEFLVMLTAAWVAAFGYASVGSFFGAFFRRPVLVALLYFAVEKFAERLPQNVGIHAATVAEPVRRFMAENMDACYELREMLLAQMSMGGEGPVLGHPLSALGKLIVITMGFALWTYCRREYDSRPRE